MTSGIVPEATGNKDRLIIFVHGFAGSAKNWSRMIELLRADPQVGPEFDMECFPYESPMMHFGLTTRIPSLEDVADRLGGFIEASRVEKYREITLVGHSQGGLVIQHCLVRKLQDGEGSDLAKIRQVVLFATPNLGATILSPLRQFLGWFPFFSRQERSLRVMDEDIARLRLAVLRSIVAASTLGKYSAPIPFECFYGTEDGIVPQPSAAGHFLNVQGLRGNHSTIIQPKDHADERYEKLREALLNPHGHLHVFEVDKYEQLIEVAPTEGPRIISARHGNQEREVETETEARVVRRATFSRHNACDDLFEIRYTTRRDGFIEPTYTCENEAPLSHQVAYEDYGTSFSLQFRPHAGATYALDLRVYKGFDAGNRDMHAHLTKTAFIKQYVCRLDLRAFMRAGYKLHPQPQLYFDPVEPIDHIMCDRRRLENPLPYASYDPAGVWEWTLENLQVGIVDLRWDATKEP